MLVKYMKAVVNLDAVAGSHWEGPKLFVHYIGGRFETFSGDQASKIWEAIQGNALDLLAPTDPEPVPAGANS